MKNSKITILAVLLLVMSQSALFSQISFSHAAGASIYASADNAASAWGFMYSPRLNVLEIDDNLTLSVGTHIGLGLTANSREGASSLALDLPLMVELNFGNGAHPDSEGAFGGFVGIGYGISKIGSTTEFVSFTERSYNEANGFLINAGGRFFINDTPIGARLSYLINSKKSNDDLESYANVYSLGIFYTLR